MKSSPLPSRKASDMSEDMPAGWKLVPIDATEAMEIAAVNRVQPYHDTDWRQQMPKDLFRLAWPALLNAAPQPPLPKVVGGEITDLMLSRACSAYVTAQEYGVSNREAMRFVLETIDNQDANLVDLWHERRSA